MDYQKHYNNLINRGKGRVLNGYKEKHHILPKCLGGDNSPENLVYLTAEEHFVAHKLLCFIYPNNSKLIYAAHQMTMGNSKQKRNNKAYGWLKREASKCIIEYNKNKIVSEETRQKQSLAKLGKKVGSHSPDTKLKMSQASKGKPKSEEHRLKLSLAKIGKTGAKRTEEQKLKMSIAIKKALARKRENKLTSNNIIK